MPMSKIGQRRVRFRIHLSTAIILMFVAGGLIWANVIRGRWEEASAVAIRWPPPRSVGETEFRLSLNEDQFWHYKRAVYGWPFKAMEISMFVLVDEDGKTYEMSFAKADWRARGVIANALVALAILFATWYICEWLIRRRSSRKGD